MSDPHNQPKQVRLERRLDSWFVLYVKRQDRQRHACACFCAADHKRADIVAFIQNNPKLELLNPNATP